MKKLWLFILLLMFPTLAYCSGGNLTNGTTIYFTDDGENLTAKVNDTLVNKWNGYDANLSNDNLTDNNTDQLAQGSTNKYANTTKEDNGQTAFGWGNHASAGYALQSNLSVKLDASRGNWKIFYSNDAGVFTELALGADGTFLKSNGATSAPSFAIPAGTGNASYSTTGGSTAGNVTVVVSEGLVKDGGKAIADVPTTADVVALSNLTNYYTKTDGNSTYFQLSSGVPWANVTSIPANTTSDQAGNTTSVVVYDSVTANNFTGVKEYARLGIYNITNSSDFVIDVNDKNGNITAVYMLCQGGTNVTGVLEKHDINGTMKTAVNTSAWIAVNNTGLWVYSFGNATYSTNETLYWNSTSINGNPTAFTLKVYFK